MPENWSEVFIIISSLLFSPIQSQVVTVKQHKKNHTYSVKKQNKHQ